MAVHFYEHNGPQALTRVDELPEPLSPSERFGPRGSFERRLLLAHKYADDLAASINAFSNTSTHSLWAYINPEGTEHSIGVTFDPKPDYFGWGLMVGQFAHQLRALLDNFVWAMCTLPEDERGMIEFPIFKDRDRFEREGARKLRGVPAKAGAIIEQAQPFQLGPEKAQSHPLWRIHELDRMDKHRIVLAVAMVGRHATHSMPGGGNFVRRDMVEDGAPFLILYPKAPRHKMDVQGKHVFDIGVDIGGTPVILRDFVAEAREEVHRLFQELRDFI
jgi:hypothetical protein